MSPKRVSRRPLDLVLVLIAMCSGQVLNGHIARAQSAVESCGSARVTASNAGFPEVRGVTTRGVKLWALLFYHPPATSDSDVKIVIKMTGSGAFHIRAVGPAWTIVKHTWIEPHTGSNWNHPGDEWGTGWRFPSAGCWRLHATRRQASGDISLQVVAPA